MDYGFRNYHPLTNFIYYIFTFLLIMLSQHPFFLFFTAIFMIFLNYLLDRGRQLRRWGKFVITLIFLFIIITPLINHRGSIILFYVLDKPITFEAILQGVINALTLFSVVALFFTFSFVINGEKLLFLFSKYFPNWALLTMLSVRFVPLFKRRLEEIRRVQQTKGDAHERSIKRRLKHGLLLIQILLTWSLEDGIQTADSMAARGYGLRKRSRYIRYKIEKKDMVLIILMSYFTGISIWGWFLGDNILTIFPILEPYFLQGREWFFFTNFIFLIGLPLLIEGKDAFKWLCWKRNN
ncbi:energy-coupling factor transporter transmembrane component T [Fervidibacillus halotolerans]|uniref:Energy-coupling factor transporter transmembrane protein EcfT n=1 Tax=Fervidibacillus halotolerans TaxID=2980027 RepID=A0A9E8LYW1_9BACI|nr:energy-coupling factor transporter transmembrane component T [Fervidibacillus halotolerans]WAA12252.1 energy-coupling factor transporter transmembrane protein EcfT [Fervidibacillus halotolerans]